MYQYPYMQPYNQSLKQEVVKVNGIQGANAYQLMPNSSAILLDMNSPRVYLCVSDGAGLKTVTPYTITEYKQEDTSEYKELIKRIERLEEQLNEQSNDKQAKRKSEYDEFIDKVEKWQS